MVVCFLQEGVVPDMDEAAAVYLFSYCVFGGYYLNLETVETLYYIYYN